MKDFCQKYPTCQSEQSFQSLRKLLAELWQIFQRFEKSAGHFCHSAPISRPASGFQTPISTVQETILTTDCCQALFGRDSWILKVNFNVGRSLLGMRGMTQRILTTFGPVRTCSAQGWNNNKRWQNERCRQFHAFKYTLFGNHSGHYSYAWVHNFP